MKNISLLLVFLLLLQSCSVYNRAPTSVEAAVAAEKRAKIITADNQKYKFKRLEIKDNRLIGITKRGSTTAKKLIGNSADIDGKNLKVDLSSVAIEEVRLRNESASTNATIGAVVASLLLTGLAIFYISFGSSEWNIGTGSE